MIPAVGELRLLSSLQIWDRSTSTGAWKWSWDQILEQLRFAKVWGLHTDQGAQPKTLVVGKVIDVSTFEIEYLETRPECLRQGFAGETLRLLLQPPIRQLWLEVHAGNLGAVLFYRQFGFRQTGRRSAYYADGGDALVMTYP